MLGRQNLRLKTFRTVFCSSDAPFHLVSQRLLDVVISCFDCTPLEMTQTEIENDVGAEFSDGLIGGYLQSSPGTFKERIKRLNVAQLEGLKDEINHLIDEAKVIAGKVKHAVDRIAHLSSKEPDGVVEDSKKIEGSLHYGGSPFGLKVRPSMTVKGFRDCIKKAHPPPLQN